MERSDDRETVASNNLMRFLSGLGPLRVLLAVAAAGTMVFTQRPGTPPVYSGWAIMPTLIIPIMAPLIFMVLMLDTLMARVMMTDTEGTERRRYWMIIAVNLLLAAGLTALWLPYFLALGS